MHQGADLAAANNTPIYAVLDGTVLKTRNGTSSLSGYVVVRSKIGGKWYQLAYIHQWKGNEFVRVGQKIKAGQQIGKVGNSGPSTAPHLHLEVWNGEFMKSTSRDPLAFFRSHGLNISAESTAVLATKAPASCTYYAAKATPLRATASAKGRVVRNLKFNAVLQSTPGNLVNRMVRVKAAGAWGWVDWYSVSPAKIVTRVDAKRIAPAKYQTTAALHVRSVAPSGPVVKTLPKGAKVSATGRTAEKGKWLEVKYGATTGWSSGGYLKKVAATKPAAKPAAKKPATTKPSSKKPATAKPSSKQPAGKKPAAKTSSTKKPATLTTTANLNLRSGAGTGHRSLAILKKGAKIAPTGKRSGKWLQVTAGSRTGWVSSSYVK